ncbi:MAG: hypothetical protein ACYSU7_17770 [Planctomycetota bacterium]|jgi:hypothetical protein
MVIYAAGTIAVLGLLEAAKAPDKRTRRRAIRLNQWILANNGTLLSVLLASLFLPPALSFGLWEPCEPKYAQAVEEMGERGIT